MSFDVQLCGCADLLMQDFLFVVNTKAMLLYTRDELFVQHKWLGVALTTVKKILVHMEALDVQLCG